MAQISISVSEWTQIASGIGDDDIEVRSVSGRFYASIHRPTDEAPAGRIISTAPIAEDSGYWASAQFVAGIAVYVKAIDAPAIALVAPVVR